MDSVTIFLDLLCLSVLSSVASCHQLSLHYRPSDEQYMMLICQISRNVASDVFILQV